MDIFSDYMNPIGFDQRLITDKLGYESPGMMQRNNNVNDRLKVALLEHELAESRRKLEEVHVSKRTPIRETFVSGGCGCSGVDGMKSKSTKSTPYKELEDGDTIMGLSMKKFLMILVVVVMAVCIIQYFTHQNEMHELMSTMCLMLRPNQQPGQQPSTGQPQST